MTQLLGLAFFSQVATCFISVFDIDLLLSFGSLFVHFGTLLAPCWFNVGTLLVQCWSCWAPFEIYLDCFFINILLFGTRSCKAPAANR